MAAIQAALPDPSELTGRTQNSWHNSIVAPEFSNQPFRPGLLAHHADRIPFDGMSATANCALRSLTSQAEQLIAGGSGERLV